MLIVDAVELTHFAAGQVSVVGQGGTHRASLAAGGGRTVLGSTP
jgi:hypothetical protein